MKRPLGFSRPDPDIFELELTADEMHSLVSEAMERITAHITTLSEQPAAYYESADATARAVMESMPANGTRFSELLDLLFDKLIPLSFNTAGPGYLAYIPGGGIFHAALADLIADSVNRYVGVWVAAPALSQIEATVVRWFSDMMGYPKEARGILTTGGSMANFTAVFTARKCKLPENFLSGTIYASDQAHHSLLKAALMAGFSESHWRVVRTDSRFRMSTADLERKIEEDRNQGRTPFLIIGSAGTTNTGAVDDLEALADLAAREGLWLHIDAAYGGFFMLTERGRSVMKGIERSDSVTLDPHKALFLPYGNGCLLVRNGESLRTAHTVNASYLPPMQADPDFVDFCQYSAELSRDFRGLRVWLPVKMHGIEPFRKNLEEKLDLTEWALAELQKISDLEVVAEPQLSTLAFRVRKPGLTDEALNELNRRLLERVNLKKRVYLTGTTLSGRFVLRICIVSFRTHRDRVQMALDDIRTSLQEVRDERSA